MSDETEAPEETPEAEDEAPAAKKVAGRTMVLFLVLPALLIGAGGAASVMMLLGGGKDKKTEVVHAVAVDDHGETKKADHSDDHGEPEDKAKGKGKAKAKGKGDYGGEGGNGNGPTRDTGTLQVGSAGDPSYYLMPDLLVNLASADGDRQLFLKLRLTLEAEDPEMFASIPKLLPRITDQYQMFLRELRVDDLNGSAGGYRLRLELLRRINIAIAPSRVDAVLIEEMLVQ